MPRLRQPTRHGLSDAFCQATMAWTPEAPEGALKAYLERHGVAHLLGRGRKDDAEARMLTIAFMAACLDTFTDWLEPARYWRVVGFDKADSGYTETIEGWSERAERAETSDPEAQRGMDTQTRERVVQTERISRFLKDAGRPVPAFVMQRWAYEERVRHDMESYATMRAGLGFGLELARIALENPKAEQHRSVLNLDGPRQLGWTSWGRAEEDPRWIAIAVEAYRHQAFLNLISGDVVEAARRYRVFLMLMEKFASVGIDTGLVEPVTCELAQTLIAQGEAEEAKTLLRRSVNTLSETTGEKSSETLDAKAWLGRAELSAGHLAEAEAHLQEVIDDRERTCGRAHPLTLQAKAFLSRVHLRQGEKTQALGGIQYIQESLDKLGHIGWGDDAPLETNTHAQEATIDVLDILDLRIYGLLLTDYFDPIERAFVALEQRADELGRPERFIPASMISEMVPEESDAARQAKAVATTIGRLESVLSLAEQIAQEKKDLSSLIGDARSDAQARISSLERTLNDLRTEAQEELNVSLQAAEDAAQTKRSNEAQGGAAILSGCLSLIGVILLYWLISPTAAGSYLLTMLCANGLRSMLPKPLRPKAGVPIFFAGLIVMGTLSLWAALLWALSQGPPLMTQSALKREKNAQAPKGA